jgi:hypothetical protein
MADRTVEPEPPRAWRQSAVARLLRLLLKAGVAALLAGLCAIAPLSTWAPHWLSQVQGAVAILALLCYLGKLLYDTLFFDHYRL